jgi:cytochrome P450
MNTSMIRTPVSALDPYTDQALLDPWPLYRELREMGPVIWLEKHGVFALTHYDVVVQILRDWEAFPSSFGVMMNDDMNQVLRGNTLCSDFGRSPFVRGSRACGKRWIPPRDVFLGRLGSARD